MKKTILILGLLIGILLKMDAQITGIKYLIEYNDSTSLYDCKLVVISGEATTYPQRIQFYSQYTIVVPAGASISIEELHAPIENNQFYTGTEPCLWDIGPTEYSPPAQPQSDFHTIFPNLSPPSAYPDLFPGDTITLFSVSIDVDPCENVVRPFENGVDPSSLDMPSGGDFRCGHTFGGGAQVYSGNLSTIYEGNFISSNDSLSVCVSECINFVPTFRCLPDSLKYEWSTGDTTEVIEVCPTEPTSYYLLVKDMFGYDLDSISVFVDLDPLIIIPENTTVCAGETITIISCPGSGIWEQASGNAFGATLSTSSGGEVEVSFDQFVSGTYEFVYTIPELSDTIMITVNAKPLVNIADSQICLGKTTQAANNIPGGTWASTDPDIATIDSSTGLITSTGQGSVTFIYTSPTGCTRITSPLLVTSDIVAQFEGSNQICWQSFTFVTPNTGGTWSSSDPTVAEVNNSGIVQGLDNGIAYLVFTDAQGCKSNSLLVIVQPPVTHLTGPDEICIGNTTTITTSNSGTWSSSNDAVATIDNNGLITGVGAGVATFTFIDTATLCVSYPSEPVVVGAINNIEIEDLELCIGETTQLTSDSEGTWTSDDPAVASVHWFSGVVTAHSSGTVGFALSNDFGCYKSTYPVVLTVHPKPIIEIIGSEVLCSGETTFLTSNTNGSWSSSNNYTATIDNSGVVTGVLGGTESFTLTDWETGCTSDPITITVIDSLFTPTAINNSPNCEGENIALHTDSFTGATYEWTGPNGFTSNDQNPIISNATPNHAGEYCVIVSIEGCTSNEGCTDVEVLPSPYTPIGNNNGPLCEGETLALTTDYVSGATFVWTGPSGYTSSQQNPTMNNVNTHDAGAYCIQVTVDGCTSEEGCTDVVIIGAPATPIASNNSPLCEGEDLNLTSGLVAGANYQWTGPNGFSSNDQNPTISGTTPSESGSYCVIITTDGCPSFAGCTDVIVNPIPATPLASNNGPICEEQNLELTTAFVAGATYSWSGPNGFTSTQQNPSIFGATPADQGDYCVNVTIDGCDSEFGCTNVIINPSFITPSINSNSPICEGNVLELTADETIGAAYQWTGPNGFSSTDQNPIISNISASQEGNYCLIVIVNGCISDAICTDVVIGLNTYSPIATNNGPHCEGEDVYMYTDAVANATYAWTGPNSYTSSDQNPIIQSANSSGSGTYCVIVTVDDCSSLEGCTDVYIKPTPATPVTNNNSPICEGEDLELTTSAVTGAVYSWTGPNSYTSTDQNPIITAATSSDNGYYCVIVTVDGCDSFEGCTDVNIVPTPNTPIISNNSPLCEGDDLNFTANTISGAIYSWTGPNGYISTNQNPIISNVSLLESGTFSLVVTVDGCESETVDTDVIVNPTPAAPTASNNGPICNGDILELTTDFIAGASYLWTSPTGIIYSDQNPIITGSSLLSGLYTLVVSINGCESLEGSTLVEMNTIDEELIIHNNSPVCIGELVELSVTVIEGATYSWTNSGVEIFSGPSVSFIADATMDGIFEVTMTYEGCIKSESTEVIYHLPENITIESEILCVGESTAIYPLSGGAYTLSNDEIGVINGGSFVALKSGSTEIVYTDDLYGCDSDPVTITVFNCIEAVTSCEEIAIEDIICDYNDLVNIAGSLSNQDSEGNQPSGELCEDGDEAQNIAWLAFVALEGDYDIVVNTYNCTPSVGGVVGAQVGVYSDCDFSEQTKIYCETALESENQIRIPSNILSTGQTYFLYIDGFDRSVCDYYIDVDGFYDNTYCTDLSKVTGVAYIDANENGEYEVGETLLRNALISLSPGNFSVLTNDAGKYIINTPKGGATLTAKMNEGHWINDELSIADLTIFETCVEGIDFGFVPNLFYQEANISVANTVTRCDWETRFYFTVENTGTIDLDARFEFEFDSKASFFATNLIGLQTNGNVASGDLGIIEPFEVRQYWVKLKMPSGSSVLPILDFKTTLYNSGGIEMDEYEQSEQLRCSYDPNDKREYPDREGDENLTLMDEHIEYTIRFQNNGNDTAFQVKIIDRLDPNIDKTSIRVINSSHAVETCIENEILIFLFEDINLVDSMTNYDGSQGFVSFRCNTKEGIAENTIVHNTADIIFDTNIPIVTNTTINTLVSELCTNVTTEVDIEICEGENYNGHEESGTYTEFHPLQYGCDSMVVINLDVQGITYSSQEIEICEGEPFVVNDTEYTLYESQKITDTIQNALGCISNVFIFDVKVNPILTIGIDTTICEGLDYDGLTESGTYTMESFDPETGCDIITTIDLEVLPLSDPLCIVGIDDLDESDIKVYPNPALDVFYIESMSAIEAVSIYSMTYQKIEEQSFSDGKKKLQLSTERLNKGLYLIAIKSDGKVIYKKLIRE